LPFAALRLQISNDDKWLYARSADGQFALVNLQTRQVQHDATLLHRSEPVFSDDSSLLTIKEYYQPIQYLPLGSTLKSLPLGIAYSATNPITVLGAPMLEGQMRYLYAEQKEGGR